ncbi:glycosyltransferase family 61 protein [Reyranella sp.]|uniref:glycosyltransferase family 61 protein n=1 Tax=Reyranella sp. TaxID=1929291 RepID=UPI003D0C48D3
MTFKYGIRSISDFAGGELTVSHLPEIAAEHRPFFHGWSRPMARFTRDHRQKVAYRFGPTITEPGIAERWQDFEARYRSQKRLDTFWMAAIHDVVVEPRLLTVLSDGLFVQENIRPATDFPKLFPGIDDHDIKRVVDSPNERFDSGIAFTPTVTVDEAFLLGSGIFRNYYNWTVRYASRLRIFKSLPKHVKLLTPPLKRHILGSLALHNVNRRRVVPVKKPVFVRTLHLCAPSSVGRHELSPQLVLGLRRPSLPKGGEAPTAKRLFIPRVNVKVRRVVNEAEVIGALSKLGFTVFDCAQHSVAEQARAFHAAEMIVGTHGAGFANIVYSRPGTTVVEIIPEGYDQGVTSYRSLADHFRLKYIPRFAQEIVPDPTGNRCNSDVRIDVAELVKTVVHLAKARAAAQG